AGPPLGVAVEQLLEHHRRGGDVTALLGEATIEDPARRRLVHRVRRGQVSFVGRDQVWLQDAIDAHDALYRLVAGLATVEQVHEGGEAGVRRPGLLGGRAQPGEPATPESGWLS